MKSPLLFVLVFVMSCASNKPTPYQKEKKKFGFSDDTFAELKVATFRANSHTKKSKAQNYAEFRAIENCLQEENKHANIMDIFDKTIQKEIMRTSGSGWGPTYGFGMWPYYSRYSHFGMGMGFNTMSSNSWNETLTYPIIQVYYNCAEKILRPGLMLKEISPENMKILVKDLKGALQIEKINENSPNAGNISEGDIILKANGKRIEKVYDLIRLFSESQTEVTVNIMREGEKIVTKLKGSDITDEVIKAEKEIINRVCKDKKKKPQKTLQKRKLCN